MGCSMYKLTELVLSSLTLNPPKPTTAKPSFLKLPKTTRQTTPLPLLTSYANLFYFKSAYNIQIIVHDNCREEELIKRFNIESAKAGIKKECFRRRFFETPRDKAKRKLRDSSKGRRKKRPYNQHNEKADVKKRDENDGDNWELPDEDLPVHDYLLHISQTNNRWDNDERGRTSNTLSDHSTLPLGASGNRRKGKRNK